MLYYIDLPIIKTVEAHHDFVLAEVGYPIVRHPYNYFIDEVLNPQADTNKSFYRTHWPDDPVSEDRIRMCQAKVFNQDKFAGDEPIDVMINDIGKFVILDGNHRACIQLRFNGGIIKMNVRYISPVWQRIVDLVESFKDGHGKIYQEIDHPYFADTPGHRGLDRVRKICKSIKGESLPNNFVFEIGCNTGMFSRHLSMSGLLPVGFDISAENIVVCESLSRAANLRGFYFHEPAVLPMLKRHPDNAVGAILCLSVIHHYARKNQISIMREYLEQVVRVGNTAYVDSETELDNRRDYYKDGLFPGNKFMEEMFNSMGIKFKELFTCDIGRTVYQLRK